MGYSSRVLTRCDGNRGSLHKLRQVLQGFSLGGEAPVPLLSERSEDVTRKELQKYFRATPGQSTSIRERQITVLAKRGWTQQGTRTATVMIWAVEHRPRALVLVVLDESPRALWCGRRRSGARGQQPSIHSDAVGCPSGCGGRSAAPGSGATDGVV